MQSGFEQGSFSVILKSSICITQIIKISLITILIRFPAERLLHIPSACVILSVAKNLRA